jgi:hypothetical protein
MEEETIKNVNRKPGRRGSRGCRERKENSKSDLWNHERREVVKNGGDQHQWVVDAGKVEMDVHTSWRYSGEAPRSVPGSGA